MSDDLVEMLKHVTTGLNGTCGKSIGWQPEDTHGQ